ncbi:class I SAM-dependent methyltransferase [Thalassobaculum salexigens]|uniref:class I SAM-dependent methyltransferase n=1 Tax=Thalassobaculum salexigens TaxID=455360 RepID=UPI00248F11F0|nr:class I SAM-dependent methyltransferase [Thalassobaculum salexigens]
MSRLDSMIRRLEAQRSTLNDAAARVEGRSGIALEFGLGNGRTYDHLRAILPGREIYVFDRQVAAHPDCIPPDDRLYLGDLFETLPRAAAELGGTAVLAHLDIGTGDKEESVALSRRAAPMVADLLAPGGVVVSDQPLDGVDAFSPLPLPQGVKPGRIYLYERV